MKAVPIKRMSSGNKELVEDYFEAGPAYPCIFPDAIADWPALGKWNLDFFASQYGDEFGIATLHFDQTSSGKATKLGEFIDHLDAPLADLPGFWIGLGGTPVAQAPDYEERLVWSFRWHPLKKHRELLDDVSPFPATMPNIAARLPRDVYDFLQSISGFDFHSIYISKKHTITPLHYDHSHTIGCLVQFQGNKKVILFPPEDFTNSEAAKFDPVGPDLSAMSEIGDRTGHEAILQPGEMLIIPPDWWHYTHSHDHSITLSHNFFNRFNFASHIRSVFNDLGDTEDAAQLLGKIRKHLHSEPVESLPE
ncbi:hypothetical protein GCM10009127_21360 [Alteraurantiacibacter aestuarii]|uniref:cupin-like domain-containing protein n=1 Tax=Alteraurantiacibacter aestuarii TaxID=650004 RepID=UPI0031D35453